MKDKYIIAITILSLILTISLFVNLLCFIIISDLNETVDMHKNTIGVCNVDLKQVQNENEELRADLEKRCEKQDK